MKEEEERRLKLKQEEERILNAKQEVEKLAACTRKSEGGKRMERKRSRRTRSKSEFQSWQKKLDLVSLPISPQHHTLRVTTAHIQI